MNTKQLEFWGLCYMLKLLHELIMLLFGYFYILAEHHSDTYLVFGFIRELIWQSLELDHCGDISEASILWVSYSLCYSVKLRCLLFSFAHFFPFDSSPICRQILVLTLQRNSWLMLSRSTSLHRSLPPTTLCFQLENYTSKYHIAKVDISKRTEE